MKRLLLLVNALATTRAYCWLFCGLHRRATFNGVGLFQLWCTRCLKWRSL